MKKICIIMILAIFSTSINAQSKTEKTKAPDLNKKIENLVPRYKLYATDNTWTFLKLDTRTGKIWQVQYSVKGSDYRFSTILNAESLILEDEDDASNGRFELYKTQNMYNFILIDTNRGYTYQIQWSQEPENRGILPIY